MIIASRRWIYSIRIYKGIKYDSDKRGERPRLRSAPLVEGDPCGGEQDGPEVATLTHNTSVYLLHINKEYYRAISLQMAEVHIAIEDCMSYGCYPARLVYLSNETTKFF